MVLGKMGSDMGKNVGSVLHSENQVKFQIDT